MIYPKPLKNKPSTLRAGPRRLGDDVPIRTLHNDPRRVLRVSSIRLCTCTFIIDPRRHLLRRHSVVGRSSLVAEVRFPDESVEISFLRTQDSPLCPPKHAMWPSDFCVVWPSDFCVVWPSDF
jgi:hypothetical protein